MDPRIVTAAKEIPERLKAVMNAMFEQSQPTLRSGVAALRESLRKVDSYLGDIEREHLGKATGVRAGKAFRRGRGKRFPISEFVLDVLAKSSTPMRPVELAVKLAEETGRSKESALSNINTLLLRLRQAKKVSAKDGLYTVSDGATTGTGATAKKTRKRRAPRKKAAAPTAS